LAADESRAAFRQAIPSLGLSVEFGTASAPSDGRYHVIHDGAVIFSSESQKAAMDAYRSRRDQLLGLERQPPPIDVGALLRREMADFETRQVLKETARQKKARATRKGGKGGANG